MTIFSKEVLAFLSVAKTHSVRLAAESMNISPSALSRQIKILEENIGEKLFLRQSRGVELTKHGEIFLKEMGNLVAAEAAALEKISGVSQHNRIKCAIGIMECMASNGYGAILGTWEEREAYFFYTVVGSTDELVDMLLRQDVDVIVAFNTPKDARLNFLHEYHCPIGLVCSPSHPLASRDSVELSHALDEDLILTDSSLSIYSRVEYEIMRRRKSANIRMRTNSVSLLKKAVESYRYVTLLAKLDVVEEVKDGKLSFVNISSGRMYESLEIVTRNDAKNEVRLQPIISDIDKLLGSVCERK